MLITITTEDFLTTNYGNVFECALATSVKRSFPNTKVIVSYNDLLIDNKKYKFSKEDAYKIIRSYQLKTPLWLGINIF